MLKLCYHFLLSLPMNRSK
jgi:hypothetical protein